MSFTRIDLYLEIENNNKNSGINERYFLVGLLLLLQDIHLHGLQCFIDLLLQHFLKIE